MFTNAANLLVLDEPTNDLDIETLEVLEQRLCDYQGTLIIVSHDREFLDNVVTSTIVFEENGKIQEYVGGYTDWLRQGHVLTETDNLIAAEEKKRVAAERRQQRKPSKLSYKDQRELDQLPDEIEALETRIKLLTEELAQPDFYTQEQTVVQEKLATVRESEQLLEARIERWGELQAKDDAFRKSQSE